MDRGAQPPPGTEVGLMAKKSIHLKTDLPIDMTPMIDCVFQLIIFLMISVDLSQQDLEDLKLPEVDHALPDKNVKKNRPIVNVTQEGKLIMKRKTWYDPNRDLNRLRFRQHLRNIARAMPHKMDPDVHKSLPDDPLLLRGDEFTDWYHMAKVMEDCGLNFIMIWKIQLAVAESQKAKERNKALLKQAQH